MRNHCLLRRFLIGPSGSVLALLAGAGSAQDPVPVKGHVEGRVVDLNGAPIEGCRVFADVNLALTDEPTSITGVDGRYSVALPERQSIMLQFVASGFCSVAYQHWIRPTSRMNPNATVPPIALPPAVTVAGRVRDPNGEPIAGAAVRARGLAPSALQFTDRANTDAEGIFVLRGVPDSLLELNIEAEDHSPARLLPIDRTSPLDVRLEPSEHCGGILLDAGGRPTAGRVYLSYEDGGSGGGEAGEDGHFRIAVRPGVRYRARAWDEATNSTVWSQILEGTVDGIELRKPGGSERYLELNVVDVVTGAPIREFGAWIGLTMRQSDGPGTLYTLGSPRSGHDGMLRIPVTPTWRPGHGLAIVRARGMAEFFTRLDRPPDDQVPGSLRIEMLPERTVSGTVVDSEGNPVAGADVWPYLRDVRVSSYGRIPPLSVQSDARGRFRLGGLAARRYVINAAHTAFPGMEILETSLAETDASELSFVLPTPGQLTLDWAHPPDTEGWWIDLYPQDTRRSRPRIPRWSERLGRIRSPVEFDRPMTVKRPPVESFSVSMSRLTPGRLPTVMAIGLEPISLDGPAERTIDLSSVRIGRIRGRVSTDLVGLDRLMVRTRTDNSRTTSTLLDRDGSFTLEASPGNCVVELVDILTGFAVGESDPITVRAGDPVECRIEADAGILDVTIQLPEGQTRTAMRSLVLKLPRDPGGRVRSKQIRLADLRGGLRFVLPPGELQVGFQRARGSLGPGGSSRFVEVGMVPVTLVPGRVTSLTVKEPPRLSDEALANEFSR